MQCLKCKIGVFYISGASKTDFLRPAAGKQAGAQRRFIRMRFAGNQAMPFFPPCAYAAGSLCAKKPSYF
ncbi:MAG TPA: hypothetical protein DCG49_04800 [Ruminococcus sp.]|nr:hypothetical protein [Ruminococcus sp.]